MNPLPRYPSLYQVNTRVWLTELSRKLGRTATLDDIPDAELDRIASLGFDWIWLLSVWQTGPAARKISRSNPEWMNEFRQTLPDLTEDDIGGSGFAITGYTVHTDLGGDAALARIRARLQKRGLRLLLDFVPNHMAIDHPWIHDHPDYFVSGTEINFAQAPKNYTRIETKHGNRLFAHGRDPYFPGWPDTLQLNYANPSTQDAMRQILLKIAAQCDAVRCDMAMLVLPEVFERTWGMKAQPFWAEAIRQVKQKHPAFQFIAEVYWDLEWTLQQQGFDYTYDKRLYDRLEHRQARSSREHLQAEMAYQNKMVRFLENHDESRAASTFPFEPHQVAAVVTFLSPGLRFFHQGQMEGKRKRISPHLIRGPVEPLDDRILTFYTRLLAVLRQPVLRNGTWQLVPCRAAWDNNPTFDHFIAFAWHDHNSRILVTVNYSDQQSQCYILVPLSQSSGQNWRLRDLMSKAVYDRASDELQTKGLYLDVKPWQYHVFSLEEIPAGA